MRFLRQPERPYDEPALSQMRAYPRSVDARPGHGHQGAFSCLLEVGGWMTNTEQIAAMAERIEKLERELAIFMESNARLTEEVLELREYKALWDRRGR